MDRQWLQLWVEGADPDRRASAIVGLGVLVSLKKALRPLAEDGAQAIAEQFEAGWTEAASPNSRSDGRMDWGNADEGRWERYASLLSPDVVAEGWRSFRSGQHATVKLRASRWRIVSPQEDADFENWLSTAVWQSDRGGTSLYLQTPRIFRSADRRFWHWPLRLGFLGDPLSRELRKAFDMAPQEWLHRLATPVDVDLGFGCDLLISPISPAATAAGLAKSRSQATAIAFLGSFPSEGSDEPQSEESERALAHAGALAYVPTEIVARPAKPEPADWISFVQEIIRSISHDQPFDAAIYEAARDRATVGPLVLATEAFIEQSRISSIGKNWAARLMLRGDSGAAQQMLGRASSDYLSESGNASELLKLAEEIDARRPQPRFLQARVTDARDEKGLERAMWRAEDLPAAKSLREREWHLLNVWIAPMEYPDLSALAQFPDGDIPLARQGQDLQVVVAAPGCEVLSYEGWRTGDEFVVDATGRLRSGGRGFGRGRSSLPLAFRQADDRSSDRMAEDVETATRSIWVTEWGASGVASFLVRPQKEGEFKARVMILHGNRILQTAILSGIVNGRGELVGDGEGIRLIPEGRIRPDIDDLEERRAFDLAILTNDGLTGEGQFTAISEGTVLLRDLQETKEAADRIQSRLAAVIDDPQDFTRPDGTAFAEVLIGLALEGVLIRRYLSDAGLAAVIQQDPERIQLVSAKPDEVLPLEFIYDGPAPNPRKASICPNQSQALQAGNCSRCPHRESADHVCSMRFWGVRKTIERQLFDASRAPSSDEVRTQAPSPNLPGIAKPGLRLFACSNKARKFRNGAAAIEALEHRLECRGTATLYSAQCWDSWRQCVADHAPKLLVLLPHTDVGSYGEVIEIGATEQLTSAEIDEKVVGIAGPVIVMLLGCQTASQAIRYASFVASFRHARASVVIGTLTPILGRHAVPVAGALIEELDGFWEGSRPMTTVGDAMAAVRRRLMKEGLPLGLCVVAFGDADWLLGG